MATKPNVTPLVSSESLKDVSRAKINANLAAVKASIDAVIDEVSALGTVQASIVTATWNGSTYGNRPTGLTNGYWLVIGPVAPPTSGAGALLSRDEWRETAD